MSETSGTASGGRSRVLLALLPFILFAGLAALFFVRLDAGDASRIPSALIGKPVPERDLPALEGLIADGKPVPGIAAADFKRGEVTVVNVFASWCGPCHEEHPVLAAFARSGVARLVGINYKDDAENARRFLGELGNPYAAVGTDASGRAAIDWGVYGVPETFVIRGDGTIAFKYVGPLTPESVTNTLLPAIEAAKKP
ncbi:MAG: DsbE family thiol:disulfide interchange protein [Labrys sp. (in: a-proteobacteria)]|jgi:cytochrome c biogenesis protein CcmG/thiol:disulfide interchange protein DsbE